MGARGRGTATACPWTPPARPGLRSHRHVRGALARHSRRAVTVSSTLQAQRQGPEHGARRYPPACQ